MRMCVPGRRDRGPPSVGRHLLLPALWRPECSHAGGEQSAAPAGRLQELVPGIHEQPRQAVRPQALMKRHRRVPNLAPFHPSLLSRFHARPPQPLTSVGEQAPPALPQGAAEQRRPLQEGRLLPDREMRHQRQPRRGGGQDRGLPLAQGAARSTPRAFQIKTLEIPVLVPHLHFVANAAEPGVFRRRRQQLAAGPDHPAAATEAAAGGLRYEAPLAFKLPPVFVIVSSPAGS